MKLLNLCALVGVVVGCSSTTVVQSHPADAAVEDTSVADTAPPPPAGVEGCTGGQTVVHNYPPGPYGFGVGQTLADFCLQGYLAPDKQTLEPLALHDYFDWAGASGNTVLFLSAGMTWCGPCNAEAAQLPKASTDMAGKGAVIFQVLLDGPTAQHEFCQSQRDVVADIEPRRLPGGQLLSADEHADVCHPKDVPRSDGYKPDHRGLLSDAAPARLDHRHQDYEGAQTAARSGDCYPADDSVDQLRG